MKWNSQLYDTAQSYVSEYGKGLIEFIPQKENISILDLGCGTGDLTQEIYQIFQKAKLSLNLMGLDSSPEMIEQAKGKYPHISFDVCEASSIPFFEKFDVIFSNAVFHWIPEQNALHKAIYRALKNKGLLICEFGATNNINHISTTFNNVLKSFNNEYINPFYFPTVEKHAQVLTHNAFTVESIYDYDRPTPLPYNELGLRHWMSQFFSTKLNEFAKEQQEVIFANVENQLRVTMFDGEKWIADYRRLRVIAHK